MSGWLPTHLSRSQLEEWRLAALEWLQQGTHSYAQIAEHFGVSVHTVNSWKTRLKRNGTLQATVSSGPPSRLTPEQHAQLWTLLKEGPLAHGYADDTWTTRRVQELIGQAFEVWYHSAL